MHGALHWEGGRRTGWEADGPHQGRQEDTGAGTQKPRQVTTAGGRLPQTLPHSAALLWLKKSDSSSPGGLSSIPNSVLVFFCNLFHFFCFILMQKSPLEGGATRFIMLLIFSTCLHISSRRNVGRISNGDTSWNKAVVSGSLAVFVRLWCCFQVGISERSSSRESLV